MNIPLGYSEEYDALPTDGKDINVWCQTCDRYFVDRMRKMEDGCRVLACLCPECRSEARMRHAAPLPVARVVR